MAKTVLSTDQVRPEERAGDWSDILCRPFGGLRSITEVAFAWGFSSPGHFSRIFRARQGASPRDWRCHRRPE